MLTLYHSRGSFSSRILWLLEELGAEYTVKIVSYPNAGGSNADPRNPHRYGYTPTLSHEGQTVTETGAIALYLTDLFPDSPVGNPLRSQYLTWLFYQVGLTEPPRMYCVPCVVRLSLGRRASTSSEMRPMCRVLACPRFVFRSSPARAGTN